MSAIFIRLKYIFNESDFCTNTSHFTDMFFLALWVRKLKKQFKLAKDKIRFDL